MEILVEQPAQGVTELLQKTPALANFRDEVGDFPLCFVQPSGMVDLLIEFKANLNSVNNYGETALFHVQQIEPDPFK